MSYLCAHCGKRTGMMGCYRTETDPSTPLNFCPETLDVHQRGKFAGMRCGFVCDEGHTCRPDEPFTDEELQVLRDDYIEAPCR